MPFNKGWIKNLNLLAKVYITQSCFQWEDILKFSPIPGIFGGIFLFQINYKYINLFAGEVSNA